MKVHHNAADVKPRKTARRKSEREKAIFILGRNSLKSLITRKGLCPQITQKNADEELLS
jgi:hypothetical protein